MECNEFLKNYNDVESGTLYRFIKGHKLTREVFYAGLIVFLVPSVFCDPDWSRLSFDKIYNDTNYAQLYHRPRPYNVHQYSTSTITYRPRTIDYSPATIVHSSSNIVHSPINTHYSPTSITHSSSNIVHRPSTIGYNPSSISHSSSNIIHSPRSIGHSSSNIVHSPITKHNSHSSITHSSSNLDHITSTIVHSSSDIAHSSSTTDYSPKYEDFRGNELEYEEYDYKVRDDVPLLIGISHDPFRYSVPEDDYLKGVRNMNPKSIMSMGENRGKRGVLHLYNMMQCATGCDPLAYKGYGCYCGFLGSGRPTDGIDRCCKMHDECYENIYCPFYTVYFQPYYWKCYRGQPLCALENAHTRHQFINGCAARLCECDRRFAMCVKRYSCPRRRALCRSSPIRLLQNILMFR